MYIYSKIDKHIDDYTEMESSNSPKYSETQSVTELSCICNYQDIHTDRFKVVSEEEEPIYEMTDDEPTYVNTY